jgi:hypothetical protein
MNHIYFIAELFVHNLQMQNTVNLLAQINGNNTVQSTQRSDNYLPPSTVSLEQS